MHYRMPSVMSANVNGPPLSGMNSNSGPIMESGVPIMHPNQYALANMMPHAAPHLHERELLLSSGIPVGPLGPGPHGGIPHLAPHLMHPHHPHHNHPGIPIGARPSYSTIPTSPDSKFNEFNRRLLQRNDECDNIWWDTLITEFFEDDAVLSITFSDEGLKRYTIGRTLIPRYFRSIFESGCTEYYFFLRIFRDSFQSNVIIVESEAAQMVMTFPRPIPATMVTVEGRLILEFTFDEYMRIRNWTFQIRSHREFVLKPFPNFACNQEQMLIEISKNLTRCGIPGHTLNFFRICTILEPMQELMSRQKAYSLSPKDCLKTTLFQKWQRMVAPPGQTQKSDSSRQSNKRRKRKGSSANSDSASNRSSRRKHSPQPTMSNLNQPGDVMIVGEPTLMGGEFGDEDERSITRLENTQYDTSGSSIAAPIMSHAQQPHMMTNSVGSHMSIPQLSASLNSTNHFPVASQDQMPNFQSNSTSDNNKSLDNIPLSSSNLNGSLNNLLKTESRLPNCSQYPGACSTPGAKTTSSQDQTSDDQSVRSAKTGPPRPTSQGNQAPAFQDGVFGFATEYLSEFSDKSGDLLSEHQRPISEPLPLISGPVINTDLKNPNQ